METTEFGLLHSNSFLKKIGPIKFDDTKPIGEGSFGKVYQGTHDNYPSEILAIKKISLKCSTQEAYNLKALIDSEISVMKELKHENIISLKDVRGTDNNVYIVSEYCPSDLQQIKDKISQKNALTCLKHIVKAMIYSNSMNIIHRDIKPANILIKDGKLKICDFGFARFVDDPAISSKMSSNVGTPLYMAPEIYDVTRINSKCDVWSVGILFFELIFHYRPWFGKSIPELFQNIKQIPLKFPEEKPIDDDIKDLIIGMLQIEKENRLSFLEIIKHNVFKRDIPDILEIEEENNYILKSSLIKHDIIFE